MKISFLGTSSARVDSTRDNTSILIDIGNQLILVDCSGNPIGKILKLGYRLDHLQLILITHLHIDHCYGLPALLFHLFLEGRSRSIHLAAPAEEFSSLERQLEAYEVYPSVRSYSVSPIQIPLTEGFILFDSSEVSVQAFPVDHSRASRAYKIIEKPTGYNVVISGDTRPSPGLSRFANKTNLLIHESTYLDDQRDRAHEYGHSTALDAGRAAHESQAHRLALVHLDLDGRYSAASHLAEAKSIFNGLVFAPNDLDTIDV